MPLWDAARAQVDVLKSAPDIDPDADFIFYHDISSNFLFRELAREARGLQAFALPTRIADSAAQVSTTLPFRRYFWPCRFRIVKLAVSVEWTSTAGTGGLSMDVLNSGMSLVGGAANVATGRIVASNNNYYGEASPAASMTLINQYDRIDLFIAGNSGGARAPLTYVIGYRE
jgi:hypothetical protein